MEFGTLYNCQDALEKIKIMFPELESLEYDSDEDMFIFEDEEVSQFYILQLLQTKLTQDFVIMYYLDSETFVLTDLNDVKFKLNNLSEHYTQNDHVICFGNNYFVTMEVFNKANLEHSI